MLSQSPFSSVHLGAVDVGSAVSVDVERDDHVMRAVSDGHDGRWRAGRTNRRHELFIVVVELVVFADQISVVGVLNEGQSRRSAPTTLPAPKNPISTSLTIL